jgi:hypothetical protein
VSLFRSGSELPNPDLDPLSEEERVVLDKLAKQVVKRGMTVPAIVFLESVKPLNFIASQAMVFFEPIVQAIFSIRDYNTFRSALEKRETIEILLLKIEALDAVAVEREKRIKKYVKRQKKDWKWYQRLGLFAPRIDIPEEIVNPPSEKPSDEQAAAEKS